jgi:hypothetical protein
MTMHKTIGAITLVLTMVLIAGCGGGVQQAKPQRQVPGVSTRTSTREAADRAAIDEIQYHDMPALRMTNGLVTVLVVPSLGGRILEYKLDAHPMLWVNPDELGQTYDPVQIADGTVTVPDYGGYHSTALFIGDERPAVEPERSALVNGIWTADILTGRGQKVEVRLTSPMDSTGTGLQITRNVILYAGSTNVRIVERYQNMGEQPVSIAIKHIAQVPASLSNEEKFSEEAKVYFPLNPDSRHEEKFVALQTGGGGQFSAIEDGALMEVSAKGADGAIGADSLGGWAAYMDTKNQWAFVNRFTVNRIEDYPQENSTVTVETNDERSYMTLGVSSPIATLSGQDTAESTVEWYATRVEAPIRDVTEVAAINTPTEVTKTRDEFKIKATLGVFAAGEVHAFLKNIDSIPVGETVQIEAKPTDMLKIDKGIPLENRAASVILELNNEEGSPLGEISTTSVAQALAKAEAEEKAAEEGTDADEAIDKAGGEPGVDTASEASKRERIDLGIKANGEAKPTAGPAVEKDGTEL